MFEEGEITKKQTRKDEAISLALSCLLPYDFYQIDVSVSLLTTKIYN